MTAALAEPSDPTEVMGPEGVRRLDRSAPLTAQAQHPAGVRLCG
ncbi:MAG: hypothetical protein ACYCQM_10990 [Acidithiobacillus sp.]